MKIIKTISMLFIFILPLVFCSCKSSGPSVVSDDLQQTTNSVVSHDSASQEENSKTRMVYPEGLPTSRIVSIDKAEYLVEKAVASDGAFFNCEWVEFIGERAYYIISCNVDYPDRVMTTGWYAVDIFTREVYKYIGLCTLKRIE